MNLGGGAYIWRGLYMEGLIFGVLRYFWVFLPKALLQTTEMQGLLGMCSNKFVMILF